MSRRLRPLALVILLLLTALLFVAVHEVRQLQASGSESEPAAAGGEVQAEVNRGGQ